jgi:hypothetical protein
VGAPGDSWDHGRICAFVQVGEDFPTLKCHGGGIYYSENNIPIENMTCWVLGGFDYAKDFMDARDSDGFSLFRGQRLLKWAQVLEHQQVKRRRETFVKCLGSFEAGNNVKLGTDAYNSIKLARGACSMVAFETRDGNRGTYFPKILLSEHDPSLFKAWEHLLEAIKAFEDVEPQVRLDVMGTLHALLTTEDGSMSTDDGLSADECDQVSDPNEGASSSSMPEGLVFYPSFLPSLPHAALHTHSHPFFPSSLFVFAGP